MPEPFLRRRAAQCPDLEPVARLPQALSLESSLVRAGDGTFYIAGRGQ